MSKVGFIGTGVMGGALAAAVRKKVEKDELYLANVPSSVSEALAFELDCVSSDNANVAKECKYVFLAVKPNIIRGVLSDIAPVLKKRTDRYIVVSIAAGITIETVKAAVGFDIPVIRIMPNITLVLNPTLTFLLLLITFTNFSISCFIFAFFLSETCSQFIA